MGGWPTRSCSSVFLGLTIAQRDDTTSPVPLAVPLQRHEPREIEAGEGFRDKCPRLKGGRYISKDREPAGRRRYDGRGNIPTLIIQRVGHPAAWVGPRA